MHTQSGKGVVGIAVLLALVAAGVGYLGRPGLDVPPVQAAPAAGAAVVSVLSIPGVPGSSTLAGHVNQIDVMSWSWGASSSAGGPRGAGRALAQPLVIAKRCDVASVRLWAACGSGELFPSATLYVLATSGAQTRVALEIKLTNVSVASCNVNGQGSSGACEEQVALSYGKIEWTYPTQSPTGGVGQPIKGSWDVGGRAGG